MQVEGTATAESVSTVDSLVAELESGNFDGAVTKPEVKAEANPADEAKDAEATEETAEATEAVEASADEDAEAEAEATADDDDETVEDAPDDKRLAPIRKYEQRVRAELDQRERQIEAREREYSADIKAVREFQNLSRQARYDRVGVLRALGISDDMLEDVARECYAHSPAGQKDPKHRSAVEQSARERKQADEIGELRKRLDERDEHEKKAQASAENQRAATKFVEGIAKAATVKTAPLAAHFIAKDAARTRARLGEIAFGLWESTGEQPDARAVLKAYEKLTADEMRLYGADPTSIAKTTQPVIKAGAAINGKAQPAPHVDDKPIDKDDIVRELESGQLH